MKLFIYTYLMLSYRHAFHAGNHADVLKHLVLGECLRLLARKEKGFLAVDTHAGAGAYTLSSGYAAQNAEWAAGIDRLRNSEIPSARPLIVEEYLRLVSAFEREQPDGYPGSPEIIARFLRPQDRAVFCELHPTDQAALEERFRGRKAIRVRGADGFAELKAVLPPPTRRGLIFMDPSYELADDYGRVIDALREARKRFADGVYVIWYPVLDRIEARDLPAQLDELGAPATLKAELAIGDPVPGERGMSGSGLFVMNPPWTLEASLGEALPYLAAALRSRAAVPWTLQSRKKPTAG